MPAIYGYDPDAFDEDVAKIISPMARTLDGDDPRYTNVDDLWDDDDPEELDPWSWDGWLGKENSITARLARSREDDLRADLSGPRPIILPDEPDPGWATADRRAANRQVSPTAGSGTCWTWAGLRSARRTCGRVPRPTAASTAPAS
jgi:hypothetical protein